jgi:Holliday junction resolvase-like predicted endonuclease
MHETHARGALSEMVAAAKLIREGWHVFTNVAGSGLIDLIAVNPETGETKLYDVKTKSYRSDGSLIYRVPSPQQKAIGVEIYLVDRIDMEKL